MGTARQHVRRTSAASCTLLVLMLGAGCSAGGGTPGAPASSAAAAPAVSFGGTDLAWVEINIAMNEELLPLLELTPSLSKNPQVKALSLTVKTAHEAELTRLRALHHQAGLNPVNPHKGMPMPGMMTPALLAEAKAARGAAFDKLLVAHLRGHLEQGTRLAKSEQQAGTEAQTLALAKQVESDRAALKSELDRLSAS